jgi:hypothetical protein
MDIWVSLIYNEDNLKLTIKYIYLRYQLKKPKYPSYNLKACMHITVVNFFVAGMVLIYL